MVFDEYKNNHIKNAIFFDLDKNSKKDTDLPHMLTDAKLIWENIVSSMGIKNDDQIVIYDNSDVISSCRCWYNFIYFGHNPELVHVLDGGFKKWIKEDKATTSDIIKIIPSNYIANEKRELVKDINQINKNILENNFNVIDARSLERFEGKVPEPRKGLRSGSIKNSFCLPFSELINQDHTFISKEKIHEKFKSTGYEIGKKHCVYLWFWCTASILALAYSLIIINICLIFTTDHGVNMEKTRI